MTDDFVAYPSPWRLAPLVLLSAGFVAAGLWMIGAFGPPPTTDRHSAAFTTVIGWAAVIFFGLCGVVLARRMFDRREQLRIGPEGVRCRGWSDETIPWSQIAGVSAWSHKGSKFIILTLVDPALYPARGAAGLLAGLNRSMTGGDVSLSLVGTNRSLKEASAAIERFWPGADPHAAERADGSLS